MRRTILPTTEEGFKRRLSSTDRTVMDLGRRGSWQFDEEVDVSPGSTFYVRRAGAFSVPTDTVTAMQWDGGAYTSGANLFASWVPGTPTEVEILQDGLYWLSAALSVEPTSTTGARYLEIGVNGSSASGFNNAAALGPLQGWSGGVNFAAAHLSTAIALPLSEGDFVAVYMEQTSGVSLAMGASPIPQLSITRFAGQVTTF